MTNDVDPPFQRLIPSGLAEVELYTRAEAAAALKVRETWLRDNQTRLNLPHTNFGRQVRYSREDVVAIARLGRSSSGNAAPAESQSQSQSQSQVMLTPLPITRRKTRPSE